MTYTLSLFLTEGSHYYHFEAHVDDRVTRYPSRGLLEGPDIFDPQIILSGFWPEDSIEDDEVTFYVHFQYGHGLFPDVQELIIDDEEYTLSIESGDPIDGLNLTKKVKMEKGSHTYRFMIEVDGIKLTPATRTITVSSRPGPDDDDDVHVDTNTEGKPAAFVVVIIIIILIIVGIVAFFLVRKGKPPEDVDEEYEEDEASEGHVSGIRGL